MLGLPCAELPGGSGDGGRARPAALLLAAAVASEVGRKAWLTVDSSGSVWVRPARVRLTALQLMVEARERGAAEDSWNRCSSPDCSGGGETGKQGAERGKVTP